MENNDIIGQAQCSHCKAVYNLLNGEGFGHTCSVQPPVTVKRDSPVRAYYDGYMWEVVTEYHKGGSIFGRLERTNSSGIREEAFPSCDAIKVRNEWTGLVDKNGKRIFGGDVVKWQYGSTDVYDVVVWDVKRTGFLPFIGTYSYDGLIYPDGDKVEVIGNIYESPDLEKLTKPVEA